MAEIAETLLDYLTVRNRSLPEPKGRHEIVRDILRILEIPERSGGITYNLYFGDQWESPFFAVGLNNDMTRIADSIAADTFLLAFLESHADLLARPRCCLGVWQATDADNRTKLWMDISVLIYNETLARAFALEGNQIAFYDLKQPGNGEVFIGGTGESMEQRLSRIERDDRIGENG